MPTIKVLVKWTKEKFDLELNTDENPETFKGQLYAMSGVPPDRMKVMYKGKQLTDNFEAFFGDVSQLKDGIVLMMMGSAEALPTAPDVKPKFMEDMSEGALNRALNLPPGLKNLGNTCYMNATLQCLKTVPELEDALKKYRGEIVEHGSNNLNPPQAITASIRDLYATMGRTTEDEVVPILILQVLHTVYPHFAEKDDHGHFRQQDANELWVEVMRQLQQKLPNDFIKKYFSGRFDVTLTCKDSQDEPPTKSTDDFYQLSCFLDKDTKYIHTGLKAKLIEEIVKNSTVLGRDAKYEKKSAISRLPAYLTIQMVRFYYKEKEQVNAKILKEVKFPIILDVYDMCTAELQKKLLPIRSRMKEEDDRALELAKKKKMGDDPDGGANATKKTAVVVEATKNGDKKNRTTLPFSFEDDAGSNNSGYYELRAVLTHKGRSSSSGHYVGWVKRGQNDWLMCDDEVVRPVTEEKVLDLAGGGDWHSAYVLLYGPRKLEVNEIEGDKPVEAATSAVASTTNEPMQH